RSGNASDVRHEEPHRERSRDGEHDEHDVVERDGIRRDELEWQRDEAEREHAVSERERILPREALPAIEERRPEVRQGARISRRGPDGVPEVPFAKRDPARPVAPHWRDHGDAALPYFAKAVH